ncbi:hypothetical protein WOLCODRAFT_20162 [Wolfiporia cocos MD-104 SS10]|uniref:Uncharacterized protein n=1 Tax=Wolfiporia cocos (strain MD-104) TaxID=742152 RepID=A0A2H3J1D4_WOLCO|nr:hypothetical protein WOLCODRAFT_20162 [Wolfiporia cocos MD-104 SS10]
MAPVKCSVAQKSQSMRNLAALCLGAVQTHGAAENQQRTCITTRSKGTCSDTSLELAKKVAEAAHLKYLVTQANATSWRLQLGLDSKDKTVSILENDISTLRDLLQAKKSARIASLHRLAEMCTDLQKCQKRIRRLQLDKTKLRNLLQGDIFVLEHTISLERQRSQQQASGLLEKISTLTSALKKCQSDLEQSRVLTATHYSRLRALEKKSKRAKLARDCSRHSLKKVSVWSPTRSGIFTPTARWLARRLLKAGCVGDKVDYAIKACATVFGVHVTRGISRRTAGESTDGTTHHKITYEARHITLSAPSYELGVDDTDPSTWTYQTRFAEVAPALDHTAQRQFHGSQIIAEKIASTYCNSPLAAHDRQTMDAQDWMRKQVMQNMDHAADGKKKFRISPDTRHKIAIDLLEYRLGCAVFDKLPSALQRLFDMFLFGGCCGHKDLNAFKYGVLAMHTSWDSLDLPPPTLLANKANDSAIRLADTVDCAAVQHAVESSSCGGIKLASLAGALFCHKNDDTGYQDRHRLFMSIRKQEIHGDATFKRFPDTSNTRYQSHSYAAAEIATYLELYIELMEEICDAKSKPGANHLESNVAKGLRDPSTLAELAAMALYGVSVSWPYLRQVHGDGTKLINLLDLTGLHRRLPEFCNHIAMHPDLILNPDAPLDLITLDGQPFSDWRLIAAIQTHAPDIPGLLPMITAMFSGAAQGWVQFTSEFALGGPFDSLTPEERALVFIPSTNDTNEGALGSWWVHVRSHPNSTATTFSSQERLERNKTENFITKCCSEDDQRYVMQVARELDSSGENAHFRKELMDNQCKRATENRWHQEETQRKKEAELQRLHDVGLVTDCDAINKMTVVQLKDQIEIHRKLFTDHILAAVTLNSLPTRAHKLYAVHAAVTRNPSIPADHISNTGNQPTSDDFMPVDNPESQVLPDDLDSIGG